MLKPISKTNAILIYILVSLFLCFEMAVQVSPGVMTTELMRDFNITAFGLGIISGCYFYTYTALQIPAGMFFDRFNVRMVVVIPLLVCALGTFVFGQADNLIVASLARALMGLGSAFAFIAVLVVAADLFPNKYFALLAGITQMLAAFGAMGGELPLSKLVAIVHWRNTMNILSVVGIILALLIWFFVRYEKNTTHRENHRLSVMQGLKRIIFLPQTWFIAIYACLLWAPMVAFASLWGVPFLSSAYDLSKNEAAMLISVMWLGLALISPLLGFWSDLIGRRKLPLTLSASVGFIAFLFLLFGHHYSLWTLVILIFLCGAACSGQALSFAVVKDNSKSTLASAIGFNNMAVVISGAIFQPLTGKLIASHWNGTLNNGVPIYSMTDYRFALVSILIGFFIAGIVSLFLIKETFCKVSSSPKTLRSSVNHRVKA